MVIRMVSSLIWRMLKSIQKYCSIQWLVIGTTINWLRFWWVYLCSSGEEVDEPKWKATERTDQYKMGNETYL